MMSFCKTKTAPSITSSLKALQTCCPDLWDLLGVGLVETSPSVVLRKKTQSTNLYRLSFANKIFPAMM
ncbi:hypothetical protein ACFX2K_004733 [Malus domestica]